MSTSVGSTWSLVCADGACPQSYCLLAHSQVFFPRATWLLKSNYRAERAIRHAYNYNYKCTNAMTKNIWTCIFYASFPVAVAGHPIDRRWVGGGPKAGKALGCILIFLSFYLVFWLYFCCFERKVHGGHTKCAFNWQSRRIVPKISINGIS